MNVFYVRGPDADEFQNLMGTSLSEDTSVMNFHESQTSFLSGDNHERNC